MIDRLRLRVSRERVAACKRAVRRLTLKYNKAHEKQEEAEKFTARCLAELDAAREVLRLNQLNMNAVIADEARKYLAQS